MEFHDFTKRFSERSRYVSKIRLAIKLGKFPGKQTLNINDTLADGNKNEVHHMHLP